MKDVQMRKKLLENVNKSGIVWGSILIKEESYTIIEFFCTY